MCSFRLFILLNGFLLAPFISKGLDDSLATAAGNEKPKIKYKSTSVSCPIRIFRDEGHTPLLHRGPSLQLTAYNERMRENSITKLEFVFGIGQLQTNKKKVHVRTRAPFMNLELNYHYMKPISNIVKGKGNLYLGGIFSNVLDGRLYYFLPNNSFGYEFSNSVNPAAHVNYLFTVGEYNRSMEVGFKLNTTLLANVIRPNYIGMEPAEAYLEEDIKIFPVLTKGNQLALPNRFFRIQTELYIDRFKLNSKDKIRFFYGWGMHYTDLKQSNPLVSAYHMFGVVLMRYSDKNKQSIFKRNI